MTTLHAFYRDHMTTLWLLAAYLFSGAMSTMPALPENCGYFTRWGHDWLQFLAANWDKYQKPPAKLKAD
jgi:hypothetical protein